MSDFLLDMRPRQRRPLKSATSQLAFFDDLQIQEIDDDRLSLTIIRPDNLNIWGFHRPPGTQSLVALAGRIALDRTEWDSLQNNSTDGGLACRFIYDLYRNGGLSALSHLNGHYVVIIFDDKAKQLIVTIDRCGMVPCFVSLTGSGEILLSSNPDLLAQVTGRAQDWDKTSMAEFLITGRVTFPHTYYRNLEALDYGSHHIFDLNGSQAEYISKSKYFNFNFKPETNRDEWGLAEELAQAFRNAVYRRNHPIFGRTAVSLSGGLDSRTILCAMDGDERLKLWTFSFLDEENFESLTAKIIALTAGVKHYSLKRPFDYYADNAELGIQISGGMDVFANNHYLGFRKQLKNLGIENILAGFCCDYLLKGLTLDKKTSLFLRLEQLSNFSFEHYVPNIWLNTDYAQSVRDRLEILFPEELRNRTDNLARLEAERRRIFPLSYHPDHQQTTVPQRTMGWYLPIVDNDIIDTYLKIAPQQKLNASVFTKMVQIICGPEISAIPNTNTGASVGASLTNRLVHQYIRRFKRRFLGKKSIATDDSWPNWSYYLSNSEKIKDLWCRKNTPAKNLFLELLGEDPFLKSIPSYTGTKSKFFLRLLTLKLWIEQRG